MADLLPLPLVKVGLKPANVQFTFRVATQLSWDFEGHSEHAVYLRRG